MGPGSSRNSRTTVAQAQAEGMRNIEQAANAALLQQQSAPLLQRFALETNRELIPPDKYRELMRGLNTKQRQAVNFNRKWCKDAVIATKKGETIKPSSHTESFSVVLVE